MLTAVDITNPSGNTLSLPLLDSSAGYSIRDIGGLGPVTAALTSSSLAQVDGAQPQNARRDIRNITMKLGLKPNYGMNTVQSLRFNLYDYLLPKAIIDLGFYIDGVLYVVTSGQVESCDPVIFSADPEVDISIICYDPDFFGPSELNLSGHTQADHTTTSLIQYAGTSDAGFIFTLHVDRAISDFVITNTTSNDLVRSLELTASFIPGDVIAINTIPGSKGVTLTRSGITTSILYYMNPLSTWPFLQKGDNNFAAYTSGAGILYDLVYTPRFGGI
jgi:hypothetical protein